MGQEETRKDSESKVDAGRDNTTSDHQTALAKAKEAMKTLEAVSGTEAHRLKRSVGKTFEEEELAEQLQITKGNFSGQEGATTSQEDPPLRNSSRIPISQTKKTQVILPPDFYLTRTDIPRATTRHEDVSTEQNVPNTTATPAQVATDVQKTVGNVVTGNVSNLAAATYKVDAAVIEKAAEEAGKVTTRITTNLFTLGNETKQALSGESFTASDQVLLDILLDQDVSLFMIIPLLRQQAMAEASSSSPGGEDQKINALFESFRYAVQENDQVSVQEVAQGDDVDYVYAIAGVPYTQDDILRFINQRIKPRMLPKIIEFDADKGIAKSKLKNEKTPLKKEPKEAVQTDEDLLQKHFLPELLSIIQNDFGAEFVGILANYINSQPNAFSTLRNVIYILLPSADTIKKLGTRIYKQKQMTVKSIPMSSNKIRQCFFIYFLRDLLTRSNFAQVTVDRKLHEENQGVLTNKNDTNLDQTILRHLKSALEKYMLGFENAQTAKS